MSAQAIETIRQTRGFLGEPPQMQSLWEWAKRFTPRQGWFAFGLFVIILLVTGTLVMDADWVEIPGLTSTLVLSAIAGLALAKVRAPAALLHLAGLALGFLVILWHGTRLMDGGSIFDKIQELGTRLNSWFEIASGDGISTDLVPMSLGMMSIGWIMGYLGSWFIFRRSNFWVAVVLSGVAILTTLSFLPLDIKFTSRFFIFIFFAMLLIVRMNSIERHQKWQDSGVVFEHTNSWLTLNSATWIIIAVLVVAALLPARVYVSGFMVDAWNAGRAPVEFLEEEFARLFGIVPSRKDLFGRFFGRSLAFQGSISFDGDTVMWANTDISSYWATRTYSEYTPKGWKAGATESVEVTPDTLMPAPAEALKRTDVNQTVMMNFETKNAMIGGELQWISRAVVLETLEPMQFELDMLSGSVDPDLPSDVQEVARTFREELNPPPVDEFVESFISRRLPSDLVLLEVKQQRGLSGEPDVIEKVTLERKEPVTQEIVSWRFSERLPEQGTYSMVSSVSMASDDDLRTAGTEYSGFIRDHYILLPSSLPQRVNDLAADVTAAGLTPLDKVLIVQDYLRSPQFTYSQDIEAPPPEADGVDHFLFETQTGYSDYYASAMAVMLRSVGVPARLAGGYAPGVVMPSGTKAIVDRDSHLWVQAYFPGFGWIDFEPTPNWPIHVRVAPGFAVFGDDEDLPLERLARPDPAALGLEDGFLPFELEEDATESIIGKTLNIRNLVILISAIGGVVVAGVMVRTAWMLGMGTLNPIERIYVKMNRLGTLAGIGRRDGQTPTEYAFAIGGRIPEIATAAATISNRYGSNTYGHQGFTTDEAEELNDSWRTIRFGLFKQIFKRLIPVRSSRVR